MAETGRPKKEIDKKTFENLCSLQCTRKEICGFFECTPKTLTEWCKRTYDLTFEKAFENFKGRGCASLRRNQWKLSETNATMAIFLGKQYLGQSDKGGGGPPKAAERDENAGSATVKDLYGD